MKLLSLELENFRQFHGKQTIEFAVGGEDGNVTVIYGGNGAGKTTLLNAFTWALYGGLSEDMEEKERIFTDALWEQTETGTAITCSVTLLFEHNGDEYRLRRSVNARKTSTRQQPHHSEVSLACAGEDGAWRDIDSYTDSIDLILPKRLSQFFFFNGERIEHLLQYEDIDDAIKTLLGLEQYERAVVHLPAVERIFASELRKLGKSRSSELVAQLEQEKEGQERLLAEQKHLKSEVGDLEGEIEQLEQTLRQHEATKQLQARRDEQRRALREADERSENARRGRTDTLTRRAYKLWLADLLPEIDELASGLHARGELPAPLKRQFVEERLDVGECICGTPLRPGEEPYKTVESWRQKAGLAEVEGAWQQMKGQARGLGDIADDPISELQHFNAEIAAASEAHRKAEEILNEVAGQLQHVGSEDVQQLERRQREIRERVKVHQFRLRDITGELDAKDTKIKELTDKLKKAHGENEKEEQLRRRVALTNEAAKAIKQMLDSASESVRRRLDAKVRSVHKAITIKPFVPELNESFELRLWSDDREDRLPAPKSTGENQLLSLSFVGALAQLCRDQAEQGEAGQFVGKVGGLYPIAMDAAFGNLDNSYREAIARALPNMTSQVIVLTSKAQADGVVSRELGPHTGAEYVICVHTTKADAAPETISVHGKQWDYVVPAADYDSAELRRVG